jgi:hypothetical protein
LELAIVPLAARVDALIETAIDETDAVLPFPAVVERDLPVAPVVEADPPISVAATAVVEREPLVAAVVDSKFTIAVAALLCALDVAVVTAVALDQALRLVPVATALGALGIAIAMTAFALEVGEALTATPVLDALGLALAASASFDALGLALSATAALGFLPTATLRLERALATAAACGLLSLALSTTAALGLLTAATLLFRVRLPTMAAALVGLGRGGRGQCEGCHACYENELPHLESPFVCRSTTLREHRSTFRYWWETIGASPERAISGTCRLG